MDGFRYLRQGERVSYELEVGEKGMKAVQVELLEPREPQPPRESRRPRQHNGRTRTAEKFQEQDDGRVDDLEHDLDRLRRKMERLLSVLVAKGVMEPSDLDDLDDVASLQRAANAEEEPEAEADPEAAAEADYQDAESY